MPQTPVGLTTDLLRRRPDIRQAEQVMIQANADALSTIQTGRADAAIGNTTNLTNTPKITDGWPMFSTDGQWIYYSTMRTGRHSIHRVRVDGTSDTTLTDAGLGEEDGRAFVSADGHTLIYNKRKGGAIDILSLRLP